jgi:hypothetical protein
MKKYRILYGDCWDEQFVDCDNIGVEQGMLVMTKKIDEAPFQEIIMVFNVGCWKIYTLLEDDEYK